MRDIRAGFRAFVFHSEAFSVTILQQIRMEKTILRYPAALRFALYGALVIFGVSNYDVQTFATHINSDTVLLFCAAMHYLTNSNRPKGVSSVYVFHYAGAKNVDTL